MVASEQDVMTRFSDKIAQSGSSPYLFIGSGLSVRYASLPNWRGLIAELAKESGSEFSYVNALCAGDLPAVASSCSTQLFEEWFSVRYSDFREKSTCEIVSVNSPAKIWLAEWIKRHQKTTCAVYRDEIEAFKKIKFDGIFTTNYDTFIEDTLSLKEIIGRTGLLSNGVNGPSTVNKIHGSVTEPNSMILTTEDYDDLKLNQAYLAARLLSVFGDHPVIFVGYSLADEYIVELLAELFRLAGDENGEKIAESLYFVVWEKDLDRPEMKSSFIVRGKYVIPLTLIRTASFEWIWEALAEQNSGISDEISTSVNSAVRSILSEKTDRFANKGLSVIPLELGDDAPQHLILGIGTFGQEFLDKAKNLSRDDITADDLVRDALGASAKDIDANQVLSYWLPQFIRPRSDAYIPVWKYIIEAGGQVELDATVETLTNRKLVIYSHWRYYRDRTFPKGIEDPKALLESSVARSNKIQWLVLGVIDGSLEPDAVVEAVPPYFDDFFVSNPTDMRKLSVAIDRAKYHDSEFLIEERTVLDRLDADSEG